MSHEKNHHDKNEEKDMPRTSNPSVRDMIGIFESRQPTVPRVHIRNMSNESLLLQMMSGGLALRGIYLTERLEDQLEKRHQLIEVPKTVLITGATNDEYTLKRFSSYHKENEYVKATEILGHSAALSEIFSSGIFMEAGNKEEDSYSSTIRLENISISSYSLESSKFRLSKVAREDLKAISTMTPGSDSAQLACEHFFKKFGSHVNKGPLKFGGSYMWKCSTKGFSHKEEESVKCLQEQAISVAGEFSSACTGISRSVDIEQLKQEYSGSLSSSTCASTSLELTTKGGPPKFVNIPSWNRELAANSNTWVLIDRGRDVVAVWDIINMNHKRELGDVAEELRTAWGRRKEMLDKFRGRLDQSNVDQGEFTGNKLLVHGPIQPEAKEHLADSEQSGINCIPDQSEAEESIVNKLFVQPGVIQPDADSGIKQGQSKAEDNESTLQPNLVKMIVDLQSFEKLLEKMLITQSEIKSRKKIVEQGIGNLHSLYRGKYENVLITILDQNFQSSSLTLEDFNSMYSKERMKFEELKMKNSPPHLQAYLISLVIEISPQNKIIPILQQVTQMMEDLYPRIEKIFLLEINKVLHSNSCLGQNLQSFKLFLNRYPSISLNQSINPSTPLINISVPPPPIKPRPPIKSRPPIKPVNPPPIEPCASMDPPQIKPRSIMNPPAIKPSSRTIINDIARNMAQ